MEIKINNELKSVAEKTSIMQVMAELRQDSQKGIAVSVNLHVIPKTQWDDYLLSPNDEVLIIKATQGG